MGQHASDTAHRHVRVAIDRNDDVGPGSLGHEPFPVESAQGVAVSRDDVPIQNTHVERTRPRNILLKCPDEQDEPGWNRTGMDRTRTVCLSPPPSWGNAHAPSQTTVLGIANLVSRFRRRPTAGSRGGPSRSLDCRSSICCWRISTWIWSRPSSRTTLLKARSRLAGGLRASLGDGNREAASYADRICE